MINLISLIKRKLLKRKFKSLAKFLLGEPKGYKVGINSKSFRAWEAEILPNNTITYRFPKYHVPDYLNIDYPPDTVFCKENHITYLRNDDGTWKE